jgi:hypothetical protein
MATDLRKYTVQEAVNLMSQNDTKGVSSSVTTADATVKATAGTVYSVMVNMNGVTAADKLEIKDGSTVKLSFVATATAQSFMFNPAVGIDFGTSIVVDETKTGGTITVTVVYL